MNIALMVSTKYIFYYSPYNYKYSPNIVAVFQSDFDYCLRNKAWVLFLIKNNAVITL